MSFPAMYCCPPMCRVQVFGLLLNGKAVLVQDLLGVEAACPMKFVRVRYRRRHAPRSRRGRKTLDLKAVLIEGGFPEQVMNKVTGSRFCWSPFSVDGSL